MHNGVIVNSEFYGNTVLCNMLLPDIRHISGDWYIFQQDGAPAHELPPPWSSWKEKRQSLSRRYCGLRIHQM